MHVARLAALVFALNASIASAAGLTVSAAASLGDAFEAIGSAFAATHRGSAVRFSIAASGALLQQIAQGAPVDVFASADAATMDEAERRGLLRPGSRADFASNALVVVVPSDAAAPPKSLAELAAPAIRRIAIGVPASVPAGRYARSALEQARLWDALAAKTVGAQSVRQALDYVARGEVDAGFVYATDAQRMPRRVKVAFAVPTETPIRDPIAVVAASARRRRTAAPRPAQRSPPAQAILRRFGFGAP